MQKLACMHFRGTSSYFTTNIVAQDYTCISISCNEIDSFLYGMHSHANANGIYMQSHVNTIMSRTYHVMIVAL